MRIKSGFRLNVKLSKTNITRANITLINVTNIVVGKVSKTHRGWVPQIRDRKTLTPPQNS